MQRVRTSGLTRDGHRYLRLYPSHCRAMPARVLMQMQLWFWSSAQRPTIRLAAVMRPIFSETDSSVLSCALSCFIVRVFQGHFNPYEAELSKSTLHGTQNAFLYKSRISFFVVLLGFTAILPLFMASSAILSKKASSTPTSRSLDGIPSS